MNEKINSNKTYGCKICNKDYASYKSLWNHTNQFHNKKTEERLIVTENSLKPIENVIKYIIIKIQDGLMNKYVKKLIKLNNKIKN